MKKILIIILLLFGWKQYYYVESVPDVGQGMLAGGPPFITQPDRLSFRNGDFTISPRALIEVDARVLDASNYYFDRMSRISPMDILLGWEQMSDEAIYPEIDASIGNRNFDWDKKAGSLSEQEVKAKIGLYHLFPASDKIEKQLKEIKIGQLVVANGYLVDVKSATGLTWKTSLSKQPGHLKKKTNLGEIFYITNLKLVEPYDRLYY